MSDILIDKIHAIIEPAIKALGFDIVQVSLKLAASNNIIEVLIENLNFSPISIEDCRAVSKNIKVILSVEEIIKDDYQLEVSSAGLERPLIKIEDYHRFVNHDIKLKLKQPIEGRAKYKGKIIKTIGHNIYLLCDDIEIIAPFDLIKNANLFLTEEKFKQILKG